MMRCPQCGNDADFAIDAVEYITAYVTQKKDGDGFYAAGDLEMYDTKSNGGTEWDETSACRCLTCQHIALLGAFDVPTIIGDPQ